MAIAWTLARPGADTTLVGASKIPQLAGNLAAADIRLSDAQSKRLDEASAPLPVHLRLGGARHLPRDLRRESGVGMGKNSRPPVPLVPTRVQCKCAVRPFP